MIGAVDIGGSKIAVAAVDAHGCVAARRTFPTAPEDGPEAALRRIAGALRWCSDDFEGIGIGCTGPVDPRTGVIGDVDLLPGWRGFPLVERLRAECRVDAAMENDADAAALGEAAWGAGRGASRFLYVTVGTGIGVGIVIDGVPYRGANGWHPEAGHQTLDPAGPLCYCGARGCWEALASGPAMAAWAKAEAGPADELPESASARDLFVLARQGHALALRAVEREARYLALGLGNLITVFGPDRIALGGGVMESAGQILPRISELVGGLHGLVPFDIASLSQSALGGDAALLGAARVFQYRMAESQKAPTCS